MKEGEATAVVIATGARTYFGRTTQLVASARPKLHVEEVIARVVKWLLIGRRRRWSPWSRSSASVSGQPFVEILPLSLVLLMSAVPVALPVMFTVSMAVGSMELVRSGVLVTRLSAIEDAATMDVVCADKTGTLTHEPAVARRSAAASRVSPRRTSSATARWRRTSPTGTRSTWRSCNAARERGWQDGATKTLSFVPFSAATRRTEAVRRERRPAGSAS